MVIENLANLSDAVLVGELVDKISSLTLFIQAIGGLIILYILFNVINLFLNRKKGKQIEEINNNLQDIKKILKNKKIKR